HAYISEDGGAYYAAKDFDLNRVDGSGLALAWLRNQLENCTAAQKLLLLDLCHAGAGADLAKQPPVAEMLTALQPERDPAVFRTTVAITASGDADRSLLLDDKRHGAFAWFLSQGYSGEGDKNQDVHLEPTELYEYLKTSLASIESDGQRQQPALYLPDATPPPADRLSLEAKTAIRKLLSLHWSKSRLTSQCRSDFLAASRLCGDEPDAWLAYSLLLLKTRNAKDIDEAQKYLENVRLTDRDNLIAYEGLAWIHAYRSRFAKSIEELNEMLTRLIESSPDGVEASVKNQRLLGYAARIRAFATTVAETGRRLSPEDVAPLDATVEKLGPNLSGSYRAARQDVEKQIEKYTAEIAAEKGSARGQLMALEKKRLTSYLQFDFDELRRQIVTGLDEQ
ncbi:MAG: hypothetical protein VB858_15455, partial [Planctomycetaceae bacterium]